MKIYHGSLEVVMLPEIRPSNRTLDYGKGFYATTSLRQAEDWVRRRMQENEAELGYVNVYELSEEGLSEVKSLSFREPDDEWVDFVMANRTQRGFVHDYDVVYGPVANDKVYAAFSLYEAGIIDKQTLIAELKTYRKVDQYLFHTPQGLGLITFIDKKEVKL